MDLLYVSFVFLVHKNLINSKFKLKEEPAELQQIMFTAVLTGVWINLKHSATILINNYLSQVCPIHTFAVCHTV